MTDRQIPPLDLASTPSRPRDRSVPATEFGAPGAGGPAAAAPGRPCAGAGCDQLARRSYCSETCREREKKRRSRRKNDAKMEIDEIAIGSAVTRQAEAPSEDVSSPLSRLLAELRSDDASRYRSMGILFGYGCRRRHGRKAITIEDRETWWP